MCPAFLYVDGEQTPDGKYYSEEAGKWDSDVGVLETGTKAEFQLPLNFPPVPP